MNWTGIFLWVLGFLAAAEGAKILFVIPFTTKSHFFVNQALMEALLQRKHEVHVMTPHILKLNVPKEAKVIAVEAEDEPEEFKQDRILTNNLRSSPEKMKNWISAAISNCDDVLSSPSIKDLVKGGVRYDLAIVDFLFGECKAAMTRLISNHTIYFSTGNLFSWKPTSIPTPPSYVPESFAPRPSKMTFWQRFWNAYDIVVTRWIYSTTLLSACQDVLTKHMPSAPRIEQAEKEIHFIFTNADPVMNSPRPTMPNLVHIGATQCRAGKPLPKDLQEFADNSGQDGFIMFGLGSYVKSTFLPPETIKTLLTAFSRLDAKVLWKFEKTIEDLPPNVKIIKWMPQQDLLAHPKNRLFITHGGLLSLQEAIYHDVPVIGVPLFAEQYSNVARLKELGIGEEIIMQNITVDGVYQIINKVLSEKSYKENMKKYSAIFKDQPETPIERAVFWTEYIIRHNGAHHLRSVGDDLTFVHYFLLDVIAFVSIIGLTGLLVVVLIGKAILKRVCKCTKQNKEKKA